MGHILHSIKVGACHKAGSELADKPSEILPNIISEAKEKEYLTASTLTKLEIKFFFVHYHTSHTYIVF